MTTYEKLTPERFAENLKEDKYGSLTGARRGIGKVDWSKKEKERALELAEKHFGTEEKPAKKAVKKAAKKEAAPSATPKRRGRPPKSASAQAQAPVASLEETEQASGLSALPFSSVSAEENAKMHRLHVAQQIIGSAARAIEAMTMAKKADPNVDISELQGSVNAMTAAVQDMASITGANTGTSNKEANGAVDNDDQESHVFTPEEEREKELFRRTRVAAS